MKGWNLLKNNLSQTHHILLYVRLHVSVLMWPSSGLLTNQVSKCWLHVGIPNMFTVSTSILYCVWGYMFRSLCDHHQGFLRIKSVSAGYMLGSQLCLQLVPVYYIVCEATCFGPYWPSSGLLAKQVNKCWLHVGIPTLFTISTSILYCVWGYVFRSLCDHHQVFSRIKSINAGYMLGSQLCLQLVPVYYI